MAHAGGRPPKYSDALKLAEAIDDYFNSLVIDEEHSKPPTMAGLALAIGYADRRSLYDAEARKDEFAHIIKKARVTIENYWESRLATQSCTGAIFWLKNHADYKDKTQQELSAPEGIQIIYTVVGGK